MPSELNVEVLLDEGQIKIRTNNCEEFQKYTTNGQSNKRTTFCMLDGKLLRIQIPNDSSPRDNTNYSVAVKSLSAYNSTKWEKEVEGVEEIKELFGFRKAEKTKEIEIFRSTLSKVMELQQEKQELQDQLNTAKQELEAANRTLEEEKAELQTKLSEANTAPEETEKVAAQELQTTIQGLEDKINTLEAEKKAAEEKVKQLEANLETTKQDLQTKEAEITQLKQQQLADLTAKDDEIAQLQKAKDQEIEKLQQQPLNAEVENLKKDLETQKAQVQQLQKEKKKLEAKKQPTEQSKAPTYTAAVGVGLAAGLVAFIALERTVRLDIWVTVGIALASALAVSGATYLALKPSTQVNKVETQEVNNNALEKQPA